MNSVVGIINMDGFTADRKFRCRELGVIEVAKDEAKSFHFDIGIRWLDLSNKDRKSCMYVMKNIHKLPFAASRGSLPLRKLNGIVKDFYDNVKK